jgi:hypothetical protein
MSEGTPKMENTPFTYEEFADRGPPKLLVEAKVNKY